LLVRLPFHGTSEMTAPDAIARGLRYVSLAIVGIAIITYLIVFGSYGIKDLIFFVPFTMIPFIVSAYLVARWPSLGAQLILLLTITGYAVWFAYLYYDAKVIHRLSSTSPIAFLFVTAYALPTLAFLWCFAWLFQWESKP
jgi:hypothetical protein